MSILESFRSDSLSDIQLRLIFGNEVKLKLRLANGRIKCNYFQVIFFELLNSLCYFPAFAVKNVGYVKKLFISSKRKIRVLMLFRVSPREVAVTIQKFLIRSEKNDFVWIVARMNVALDKFMETSRRKNEMKINLYSLMTVHFFTLVTLVVYGWLFFILQKLEIFFDAKFVTFHLNEKIGFPGFLNVSFWRNRTFYGIRYCKLLFFVFFIHSKDTFLARQQQMLFFLENF